MKKVYGFSIVRTTAGVWNADFDGLPRKNEDGIFYATDKARKYSMRQDMLMSGEEVLIRRRQDENFDYLSLNNILDLYPELNTKVKSKDNIDKVKFIFSTFPDVRLFGAIVNPKGNNIYTSKGPFSIGNAINQYVVGEGKDSDRDAGNIAKVINIISYKTTGDKNEKMTTMGTQVTTERAYYMYPISINPNTYEANFNHIFGKNGTMKRKVLENGKEIIKELNVEENFALDLEIFKNAMREDVHDLNSVAKQHSDNFLNVFFTMKDNMKSLSKNYIQDNCLIRENVNLSNSKVEVSIDLNKFEKLLKDDRIEKIEIFKDESFNIKGLEVLEINSKIKVITQDIFL